MRYYRLGHVGIGLNLRLRIVPPSMPLYQAAAPRQSREFMIIALMVTLPIVIVYAVYAYRVLRGRVKADAGYSEF